jgi:hypothetical protein
MGSRTNRKPALKISCLRSSLPSCSNIYSHHPNKGEMHVCLWCFINIKAVIYGFKMLVSELEVWLKR